jgi:hypothetical protein
MVEGKIFKMSVSLREPARFLLTSSNLYVIVQGALFLDI